ncbi:MAG: Stp1/IreP family PP2C-type Ser/Thr phosphatase [Halanaerobiales bacterium]|nr:Stp1/IreP family PP2C-type Ser/Thr phosphatase [Halanaerobiales bacterium]
MSFHAFNNIGNIRENNEDSYLISQLSSDSLLLAVADGMGGHNAGEVASDLAIKSLKNSSFNDQESILDQLKKAIIEANKYIIDFSNQKEAYKEMGTTLTVVMIKGEILYFGHVGDSRIYIYQDKLKQITTDHSLVNDLVKKNAINPDQVFDHPNKNIITQALGIDKNLEIQLDKIKLNSDTLIMLCTDGLTDMLRFEQIEAVFEKNDEHRQILDELGKKALDNGGQDNITIIIGKI